MSETIVGQGAGQFSIPDINSLPTIPCNGCGSIFYEQVYILKQLSAIQSPTGHDAIIPQPLFSCKVCGLLCGHQPRQQDGDHQPDIEEIGEDEESSDSDDE